MRCPGCGQEPVAVDALSGNCATCSTPIQAPAFSHRERAYGLTLPAAATAEPPTVIPPASPPAPGDGFEVLRQLVAFWRQRNEYSDSMLADALDALLSQHEERGREIATLTRNFAQAEESRATNARLLDRAYRDVEVARTALEADTRKVEYLLNISRWLADRVRVAAPGVADVRRAAVDFEQAARHDAVGFGAGSAMMRDGRASAKAKFLRVLDAANTETKADLALITDSAAHFCKALTEGPMKPAASQGASASGEEGHDA